MLRHGAHSPRAVLVMLITAACATSVAADSSRGIYKIRHSSIPRSCQLFIGIPSAAKSGTHRLIYNSDSLSRLPSRAPETLQDRRDAVRNTWGRNARDNAHVVLRFFTYQHDQGGTGLLLEREAMQQKDLSIIRDEHLLYTPLEYGVEGVTQKVYYMMHYAVTSFDPQYILKADDDTYVNLPVVMTLLQQFPTDRAVYAGHQRYLKEEDDTSELMTRYKDDTDGKPPWHAYMDGPAYILSKGAVKAIVAMNDAVGLRFMHHEDVAVGMWVSGLDIRHIRQSDDHGPRVAYIGASSPEELMEMNATQSYCLGVKRPYSWVHPLKHPQHMHILARIVNACAGKASHRHNQP